MRKLTLQPAGKIHLADGPAFAPVAGTSLLWVSNADDDPFREATGAFYLPVTAHRLSIPSLRSRALSCFAQKIADLVVFSACSAYLRDLCVENGPLTAENAAIRRGSPRTLPARIHSLCKATMTSLQLPKIPTTAPSGEAPLCMVHKVAQEASRRTTPARADTHAVAPPLDRTFATR
jgi:hypothetical protein